MVWNKNSRNTFTPAKKTPPGVPALAEVAVAVTEPRQAKMAGSVLAAAMLLPAIATPAHAQQAPEHAQLSFKLLEYQDYQPNFERTHVRAPSLALVLPVGERWAIDASAVQDSVSGASPRYHTAISGASKQTEMRRAGDIRVTYYGTRSTWALGGALSNENDYRSRSLSLEHRWSTEDNNRSYRLGAALTRDKIGATGNPTLDEERNTTELSAGITQAWTALDLVQLSLSLRHGTGYFSDPYKFPDVRPRTRQQNMLMLQWNHFFEPTQTTLKTSYRWYGDSFGVRAHTFEGQWVQPMGKRFTLTPSLRLYTQRAASFYVDPVPGSEELPPPLPPPGAWPYISADQRLSGFGAYALALKVEWQVSATLLLDLRMEHYAQRGDWRVGGEGSPGLAPFAARHWMLGFNYRF